MDDSGVRRGPDALNTKHVIDMLPSDSSDSQLHHVNILKEVSYIVAQGKCGVNYSVNRKVSRSTSQNGGGKRSGMTPSSLIAQHPTVASVPSLNPSGSR